MEGTMELIQQAHAGDKDARDRLVAENMGLVWSVVRRFLGRGCEMEDLIQIGSIGLCKAAATDKGGCFSTYAYCLIWHEICDALIYANRRRETEIPIDYAGNLIEETTNMDFIEEQTIFSKALIRAKSGAAPSICKGIDALILMSSGYSAKEIGKNMGAAPNLVTAWVSKARKYLCALPEFQQMAKGA